MYTVLYNIHKISVLLFILLYLVKTVMLLTNRNEQLRSFSKTFRIPEIIISSAFLISGIWMLFLISEARPLFIGKLVLVVLSIPMAVVGFKREIKGLAIGSFVLIFTAYGMAEMNKKQYISQDQLPSNVVVDASADDYDMVVHGKALYDQNCILCHGEDGNLQMSGANILGNSVLSQEEVSYQIKNGKLTMPGYGGHLSDHEIDALAKYVMTFRN